MDSQKTKEEVVNAMEIEKNVVDTDTGFATTNID